MKSFLWKLYIYVFIDGFVPIGALFPLLFKNHDLNPSQIAILIALWSFFVILLQIPTGTLADKFPRKNLLILSSIARAICFGIWILWPTFLGFTVGFLFWGIRNTLSSGTLEAFIYDELQTFGDESLYEKIKGKVQGATYVSLMLSTILGGFLSVHSFTFPLLISIATPLLASILFMTIKPVHKVMSTQTESMVTVLKKALSEIKASTILLFLVLFTAFVSGLYVALDDFWSLIYNAFGLSNALVGIAIATIYGIAALAGYSSHFLKRGNNFPYWLVLGSSMLFLVVGITKVSLLLPLVFIGVYLFKVSEIKFEAVLQHAIKSTKRATIFSLKGLLYELVYIVSILLFGAIATGIGLKSVLLVSAVIFIFATVIGLGIAKKLTK